MPLQTVTRGIPSKQIILLALLGFSSTFATAVVFPNIGSFVRDRFILSDTEASLFAVCYLAPHIFFAFIWGALSDRFGRRKPFLIMGYALTAVFHFLLPFAESYPLLLFLRFCEGACSILGFSMVMTRAMDLGRTTNYGTVMGFMGASVSLGTTVAFPVGGVLGAHSIVLLCTLGAFILVLCSITSAVFLRRDDVPEQSRSLRDALAVLKAHTVLRIPFLFSFVDRFTVGFFAVTFPLYAGSAFGMDSGEVGYLLAGFLLPFSFLTFLFGRVTDAIGGVLPLLLGSTLYGIAVLFIGLISPAFFLPWMALCGILAAVMYAPSLWMIARFAPPGKRATAMGGFNAAGSIGFALGPIVGAIISDVLGYSAAFLTAGISEVISVVIVLPFLARTIGFHKNSLIGYSEKPPSPLPEQGPQ